MPGNSHTSVRSRTVAAELRNMRETRGLSMAEVAGMLGVSTSKISRIETGNSGLQSEDVAALLGYYQVPGPKRQQLMDRLRRSDQKGWWERQAGLPPLWRALIDFESKAVSIQHYAPMIIPGLVQTAEYAEAMLRATDGSLADAELDNLVAARMARQAVLTRTTAPRYVAVVHEVALRMPVGGPGVLRRQLRQLLTVAERPNVTVCVVPIPRGAHVGFRGMFMILEFAEEPDVVHVENQVSGLFLEGEPTLAGYRLAMRNLLDVALRPEASAELIAAIDAES
jgi:transcriptional regulator with XRE-family HTH domain